MMNLLFDPWIPVLTRSGKRRKIAPLDLFDRDDPPVELDALRPDFAAGLAHFLIGLFQSFLAPRGDGEWERRLAAPPTRSELEDVFSRYAAAFELFDPEQPFMQDATLSGDLSDADEVSALLVDAPGGNTLKENKDIFVKRGRMAVFAPEIAAQALIFLQINAPSGGVGYRTGLRGGGPLTTLIWPRRDRTGNATTLWQKVWLNVLTVDWQDDDIDWNLALPWCKPVRTSRKGDRDESITAGALQRGQGADPLCYWASPRRLRLLRREGSAICDLSGSAVETPVVGVLAENYGPNYVSDHFRHPLSPYYRLKEDSPQWLPLHPRAGGLGFRDWPTLCAGGDDPRLRQAAANVRELGRPSRARVLKSLALARNCLWVFGYQLDNAKVLTWQESMLPLFPGYDDQKALAQFSRLLVAAAETARSLLRGALKEVFGKADVSLADAAERTFFDRAEPLFYAALDAFVGLPVPVEIQADRRLREQWAMDVRRLLLQVFDGSADSAEVLSDTRLRHLELVARARGRMLEAWQADYRKVLDLPPPDGATASASGPKSRRKA